MPRKNKGDCIGSAVVSFSGSTIETIPVIQQASRALLQFYTDASGITALGPEALGTNPIAMITENGDDPIAGFSGADGFGLMHMGMYEIDTALNLRNAKFIAFTTGYTVYCKIQYYK
jgi:hypothetical protein